MNNETIAKRIAENDAAQNLLSDWQECQERIKANGELIEALKNERDKAIELLRAENERLRATIEAATGECIVNLPAPDSDNGRLLLANKAMTRENERLREAINRNINNALVIANYAEDEIVTEMAGNIVNDLGEAYGIGDE